MHHPLDQAITRTVLWFDMFDYPLTACEIAQWLYKGPDAARIYDMCERLAKSPYLTRRIEHADGFFYVRGRRQIVAERAERSARAHRVITSIRFQTALRLLRFIPFVRFVALVNSYGFLNAKKTSDVDLFVIVSDRALYTTRLFITALFHCLGIRRHRNKISRRACLSFYVTESGMALERFFLAGSDPYFHFWGATLQPVFDAGIREDFEKANPWIRESFPGCAMVKSAYEISDSVRSRAWRNALEKYLTRFFLLFVFEYVNRAFQTWHIRRHPCAQSRGFNASVVISDTTLKFHENDRRDEFRRRFWARLKHYHCG